MPKILDKALRLGEGRQFKSYAKRVDAINRFEPELELLEDDEIREQFNALRERAVAGEDLDDLLPECFAITREVGKRTMGMRHFDVQLIGGMVLHSGAISEMKTGEGKTLTGTLATILNAIAGKGVHIVTVNDYLARRDAEWMSPIYDFLGVTWGVLQNQMPYEVKVARLRRGHHLRHELGVRLRLPARQHGLDAAREGPARPAHHRGRQGGRHPQLRDRRRGRQHPHRRGAHAADHLRRPRAGGRALRAVRQARPPARAGQAPGRHGPAHQEGVRRRLRLRVRGEAQDDLGHRAGRREGRAVPAHRPPLPGRERPPRQPPAELAEGRGALQA